MGQPSADVGTWGRSMYGRMQWKLAGVRVFERGKEERLSGHQDLVPTVEPPMY